MWYLLLHRGFIILLLYVCGNNSDINQAEAITAMLEVGADVNRDVQPFGTSLLMVATLYGHPNVVRAIATTPGVKLDAVVNFSVLFYNKFAFTHTLHNT